MSKKLVLLIFSSLLCFVCVGCSVNPVTGEAQLNLFGSDIRNDMSLGRQWAPQLEKEFGGVVENVSLGNYVNYVGRNIAQAGHAPNLEWHFKVLRDNSVNAFALPGGYIYITTGMLKKLNSEAQLAGVLAHESVHVTARHTTARMSEQIGLDILLSAVMPKETQQDIIRAASIVRRIVALKYSRDDERQADTTGLAYMVKAGYNPYGMVETMRMLAEANTVSPIEFLSSHPAPQNRMEYLAQKIRTNYYNLSGLRIGKEDYHRAVLEQLNN